MESKQVLFKPTELYETTLKNQYHQEAEKYFDDLAKANHIDVSQNRVLSQKIAARKAVAEEIQKKNNSTKTAGVVQLVFAVILLILGLFFLLIATVIVGDENNSGIAICFVIGFISLAVSIFLFIYRATSNKKKAQAIQDQLTQIQQELDKDTKQAYLQLDALNKAFDWNIPARIMEKTTPIIDLDPYFTESRLQYLITKFGVGEVRDPNYSVLDVLSGNIQGNPFIIEKLLSHTYGPKLYTGEKHISWTTSYTDSKGNVHTQFHEETLHAHCYHDAPAYNHKTLLIYGNEAAPHLSFTHEISDANKLKDEKEIDRYVQKKAKELQNLSDQAIQEGHSFTPMSNTKFEAFFNAYNRDNEVEFRLLFTPLAQSNMLDLMFSKPFGDDFIFQKDHMVNIIYSLHSQNFDYSADPALFRCYDYDKGRENFVQYCDQFIENLFFDLAPLLSIPLYQMYRPHEEIYSESLPHNYTSFEAESMANRLPRSCFLPKDADPELPVMEKFSKADVCSKSDKDTIFSYSYMTVPRCDHFSVKGGDGYWHDVPVYWTEYIRKERVTPMVLKDVGSSREKVSEAFNSNSDLSSLRRRYVTSYAKGLLALVGDDSFDQALDERLDKIFEDLQ